LPDVGYVRRSSRVDLLGRRHDGFRLSAIETQRLLSVERPIDVIHNFFTPRAPRRSREQVRSELGVGNE